MQNGSTQSASPERNARARFTPIFLLGAGWTLALAGSLAWNVHIVKENLLELARTQARTAAYKDIAYRQWWNSSFREAADAERTSSDTVTADVKQADPPSSLAANDPGPVGTRRPAFHAAQSGLIGGSKILERMVGLRPTRKTNTPDAWEAAALQKLVKASSDEVSDLVTIDGQQYMRLMQPLRMEQPCLSCHAQQGYQAGDIAGGISVSIPLAPLWVGPRRDLITMGLAHGVLWLLGLLGLWDVSRQLRKLFGRLEHGNRTLRERNQELADFNQRLTTTAKQLSSLMASITDNEDPQALSVRFDNPRLAKCWEVQGCGEKTCPAYGRDDNLRCWEIAGTFCKGEVQGSLARKLKDCRKCQVYRQARTDPLLDLGETFNEMIAYLEDRQRALIEARREAEAAARAKSEFLANMSHEIRTPMTAILGFAETLLEPDQTPSDRLDAVYTIYRSGEHLLAILNDILDLSKIEAGKLEVERLRCSPVALVAEVLSLMQVRAAQKKIGLKVRYEGSLPETIETDPTRLRQILVNLVGNAVKFTDSGGVEIVVRLLDDPHAAALDDARNRTGKPKGEGPDGAWLSFAVIDTGIGLTPEQTQRIFHYFEQADASTTRKFGGTGLGLALSKRLAHMLGGDIYVQSEWGRGSTFTVVVPTGSLEGVALLEDPATATTLSPRKPKEPAQDLPALNCRILLVEDGQDNQRLIGHFLEKAGAEVTIVSNGREGVEAALAAKEQNRPFDIILMDMQMPVMDGYEATRLLRQKGYGHTIIALTAHAMKHDRAKCLAAGCDDYVSKPVNRKRLHETIQTCLGQPRASVTREQAC